MDYMLESPLSAVIILGLAALGAALAGYYCGYANAMRAANALAVLKEHEYRRLDDARSAFGRARSACRHAADILRNEFSRIYYEALDLYLADPKCPGAKDVFNKAQMLLVLGLDETVIADGDEAALDKHRAWFEGAKSRLLELRGDLGRVRESQAKQQTPG